MKKALGVILLLSALSCGTKINKEENRLSYSEGKYYIYYDKEVLEIPTDSYITNDAKIDDYFYDFFGKHVRDKRKLLSDLSKYFPHGITEVVINGEVPSESFQIPTMDLDGKKILDSIHLSDMLLKEDVKSLLSIDDGSDLIKVKNTDQVDPNISLKGKKLEVLNANGINKFASKIGEAFKENLGMDYNAENYPNRSNISYVINHTLNEKEFAKFVNSVGIKYIKIKEDPNLKPDSDVVLITGNDKLVNFNVDIYSTTGASELMEQLNEYKPRVFKANSNNAIVGVKIKHNKEDEIIAKKILQLVPSAKLEIDNKLKNKIEITTNR